MGPRARTFLSAHVRFLCSSFPRFLRLRSIPARNSSSAAFVDVGSGKRCAVSECCFSPLVHVPHSQTASSSAPCPARAPRTLLLLPAQPSCGPHPRGCPPSPLGPLRRIPGTWPRGRAAGEGTRRPPGAAPSPAPWFPVRTLASFLLLSFQQVPFSTAGFERPPQNCVDLWLPPGCPVSTRTGGPGLWICRGVPVDSTAVVPQPGTSGHLCTVKTCQGSQKTFVSAGSLSQYVAY